MKEVKVKGCSDCPLKYKDAQTDLYSCLHPNAKILIIGLRRPLFTPTFCPLLTEPITIKLDKDGD